MRYFAYIRKSSKEKNRQVQSIPKQYEWIKKEAIRRGINANANTCTPINQCNVNRQSIIIRNFTYFLNQAFGVFFSNWPIIKIFKAKAQSKL